MTQYEPAFSDPVSCAVPLACAVVNEFASGVHPVIDDDPTARPIATVVSRVPFGSVSVADVSVTLTLPPPWPTVKLFTELWSTPFTGGSTVPVSTSVVMFCVGAVVDDELFDPEQADAATIATSIGKQNRIGIMV